MKTPMEEMYEEALALACDALMSIADHPVEFADLEDSENMVVRMSDKATDALKELRKYEHH